MKGHFSTLLIKTGAFSVGEILSCSYLPLLLVLSTALLLAACSAIPLAKVLNDPAELETANTIEIYDAMGGMPVGCFWAVAIMKEFTLYRAPAQYEGQANFHMILWTTGEELSTNEPITITIPLSTMRSFFDKLGEIRLKRGRYKTEFVIDCDPSREIVFLSKNREIEFFSSSCTDSNIPWKFTLTENDREKSYIIQTEEPYVALEMLSPYLREDALEEFLDKTCPK